MKLRFYYTFAEFRQSYTQNYYEYLLYFPEATEQDFAKDYMREYQRFFLDSKVWNYMIPVKKINEEKVDETDEFRILWEADRVTATSIFYLDYMEIVENRLREYIMDDKTSDEPSGSDSEFFPILDMEYYNDTHTNYSICHKLDGYILDRETFDIYKELMSIESERFPNKYFICISPDRFKSFRFSVTKIYDFLDDVLSGSTGIQKQEAEITDKVRMGDQLSQQYNDNTKKLVNDLFGGDYEPVELLNYLSDNFNSASRLFTDLTKYNHIYRFMKTHYNGLEQSAYKDLVLELFGFDYGNKTIKGDTSAHLKRLKMLASFYKESSR